MRMAAVALLLTLAACSGGSGEPQASASTTATVPVAGAPTNPPPTGTPAPEALSSFRCDADGSGTFTASGVLANDAKAAVTFQVTVYVGQPSATPQAALTKQVPKVAGGGSTPFEMTKIPAGSDGGTCHVQVVTTK